MTEVLPFKAIMYNTERVNATEVVCPPYDVIDEPLRDALYEKSPYNFVRIDFGKPTPQDTEENNVYIRSRDLLNEWLNEGVLIRHPVETYYIYEVQYEYQGRPVTMTGLMGRVRITELCEGVFPHEATHSKPKKDRLELMKHCRANLSPIFSLYNKPERSLQELFKKYRNTPPYMVAEDLNGFVHRMWVVEAQDAIEIQDALRDVNIYIADGHHRYEVALEYKKMMQKANPSHTGNEPYNFVLMYLVNISDGGLTILPTHRLVREMPVKSAVEALEALRPYFEITEIPRREKILEEILKEAHLIGMALKDDPKGYILRYKGGDLSHLEEPLRKLDVTVLHELIFKKVYNIDSVQYEMDPEVVLKRLKEGFGAGFFLRPTSVEEVEAVALQCLRMPPKSTYFYPKLLTGFVINPL
ncbi:MAG: DUF1015 domain-containing protein [Nitrospirae bacterium]|nr:MAG: DUF1015 domain-containing protein [Nitrospirota bacterium]